jgi:hypothetical protein
MKAISYNEAVDIIAKIGALPNPEALAAILGNIEQTFDGAPCTPR